MMSKHREVTTENIEKTIALNLLAPYTLTSLLMDELRKSTNARIVMTASSSYSSLAGPDFNDIELTKGYTAKRAYGNAKLFLIMVSQMMNEKLEQRLNGGITLNFLHPGVVATKQMLGLVKQKGFLGKVLLTIVRLLTKTPEQGAKTTVYLASSSEVQDISGQYFINRKAQNLNEKHISEKTKMGVWEYCKNKTGVAFEYQ
jgi:NAD(P)-dependent dehydrogenase (short-subunit alcohol dehydrogenase family)